MAEEHNLNIRARLDTSDIQAKLKNLNTNNPASGNTNSLSLNNVLLQLNNTLRSLQIAIRQMQASNGRQTIPQNAGNLRNNTPQFMPAGQRAPASLAPPLQRRSSDIPKAIKKLNAYDQNVLEQNINERLQHARNSEIAWRKLYKRTQFNKGLRHVWRDVLDDTQRDVMSTLFNIDRTGLPKDVGGMRALTKKILGKEPSERWAREQLAFGHLEPGAVGTSYKDFQKRMDKMFPKKQQRLSKAALFYLGSSFVADPLANLAEYESIRGNNTAANIYKQSSNAVNNLMQGAALGFMVGGPAGAGIGLALGAATTALNIFTDSLKESAQELKEAKELYKTTIEKGSAFLAKMDAVEARRLEQKGLDNYKKNIDVTTLNTELTKNKKELADIDSRIEKNRAEAEKLTPAANLPDRVKNNPFEMLNSEFPLEELDAPTAKFRAEEYDKLINAIEKENERRQQVIRNIEQLEGFKESQDKFLENEDRAYYATLKADYPDTSIDDFQKTLSFNKRFSNASDAAGAAAFDAYDIASKLASARSNEYITRGIYEKRREELRDLVNSGNFNLNDYEQLKYSLSEARSEWQEAKAKSSSLENIQNANNRFEINSLQDWVSEIEKAISNLTRPDLSNVQSMASIGANMGENDINVERQMNYWAKTIELQTTMKNLLDKIEQKENSATFN